LKKRNSHAGYSLKRYLTRTHRATTPADHGIFLPSS
jgi:hypothetical protein